MSASIYKAFMWLTNRKWNFLRKVMFADQGQRQKVQTFYRPRANKKKFCVLIRKPRNSLTLQEETLIPQDLDFKDREKGHTYKEKQSHENSPGKLYQHRYTKRNCGSPMSSADDRLYSVKDLYKNKIFNKNYRSHCEKTNKS